MRCEIRFSGRGGQGLLWMAATVADAALKSGGLHATQSASYGSATRGGYSRADVVISDDTIDYPWVMAPDILVAMAQSSFGSDFPHLKQDGKLIVEPTLVKDTKGFRGATFPVLAMQLSEHVAGSTLYANSVLLAVLDEVLGFLAPGAMREAVGRRSPGRSREENLKAYDAGKAYYAQTFAKPARKGAP